MNNGILKYYDTDINMTKQEKMAIEKQMFEDLKPDIPPQSIKLDTQKILSREESLYKEKEYHNPQNIFFIYEKNSEFVIFGRKCWSILNQKGLINSPNCSLINYIMLLGIMRHAEIKNRTIEIKYLEFNTDEKYALFQLLKSKLSEIEIVYPFVYRDFNSKEEKICSENGWSFSRDRKINLSNGEIHFRKKTLSLLEKMQVNEAVIYDPACSTGEFLHTIKNFFPNSYTIGHDISQEMISHAKDYVDEVLCVDAKNSPLEDETVDIMFLRFLNSEIVSRSNAIYYFRILIKKLKKTGYCICFGHTPFLLCADDLKKCEVEVLSAVGLYEKYDSIFQYYVLRRK